MNYMEQLEAKLNKKYVLTGSDICLIVNIASNNLVELGSSILDSDAIKKVIEGKELP